MTDEIEKKRNELLTLVREFQSADDHADGLHNHPKISREWLDELFRLNTELVALQMQEMTAENTHTFTVNVVKGEPSHFPGGVERQ